MDFPGVWQHFSIPADALTEETFEEGIGFDGSSVVGWRAINEADLLVVPQPETALVDPFAAQPTLTMICNIHDPITHQDYTRDPRNIARKAVSYMRSTGIADIACSPPSSNSSSSTTSASTSARTRASTTSIRSKGPGTEAGSRSPTSVTSRARAWATSPALPPTAWLNLRSEMAQRMAECGIATSAHFHEVATGGQCEIDLDGQSLVESADQVMMARYIIRNVASTRRQDGHVHAQAALRRQRLGDAHPHVALEGRRAAAGRQRLRRA